MKEPIKVIIVDDSAVIRRFFSEILKSDPEIEVIATANDPYDAREKIKKYNPDVITLDVEMPKMNGVDFLEKIMRLRPMPVLMVSTLTQKGADTTMKCLELGAVDYIGKPQIQTGHFLEEITEELVSKVKIAAKAKVAGLSGDSLQANKVQNYSKSPLKADFIAIGSSTGGVEALRKILSNLPLGLPPIGIVQHMRESFLESFATRLNDICATNVKLVEHGEDLKRGCVYIGRGEEHFEVRVSGGNIKAISKPGEKVGGHLPAVDVLFSSVAQMIGNRAIGVMLTGMGSDGANGMVEMHNNGAYNIGQNEESCVVYGMPKAAFNAGAIDKQLHLSKIADEIVSHAIYK